MSEHAFFIAGDRIRHIANAAGAGAGYRAARYVLAPDGAVAVHRNDRAETTIAVIHGVIELMVDGASGHLAAGEFARIPPRATIAYRSASSGSAELLVRVAPAPDPHPACRVMIDIAAA
jgi:glyoxylate utilization-related uncharacterized protein